MKKTLFLFVILLFTFAGCKLDDSVISPTSPNGKALLKFEPSTIPEGITLITAVLTRQGFNTVSGNLNILNDSTAEISFQNLTVGMWHLLVQAKDSIGMVRFSGEADVNILENQLTQVNLTLVPTGTGIGSIHIVVNWGVPASGNWIDFNGNPIFTRLNSPLNPNAVSQAKILCENGVYKMWFINVFNSAVGSIGYAKSNDGINWNYIHPTAVLSPGNYGSWDSYSVAINAIIKDGNEYKMYYSGYKNQYDMWHIGLATSLDGVNWIKRNSPVLSATSTEYQIVASDVIKVGGLYYMYFTVISNSNNLKIYLAISNDGINWERYNNNPILMASQQWEGTGIYFPSVIYDSSQFKMVFSNKAVTGLGMAVSSDGKNWDKSNSNPFFTANQSFNQWTPEVAYPFYRKFGNEYRIYYSGTPNNYAIGFVRKVN